MTKVYISIGSNMGEKLENCQEGLELIEACGAAKLIAVSDFYKTEPVDYLDQDWFVNAAALVETELLPHDFLKILKKIESDAGRQKKGIRFGPRILDMDILLYGDLVLDTPLLVIPHPRMDKRRFVLGPLCDIDPFVIHPVLKKSMRELLEALEDKGQKIISLNISSPEK